MVTVIGLGQMGLAMAGRLMATGGEELTQTKAVWLDAGTARAGGY